jgi:mRNA interferase RelE/StbE
MPTNYEVQIKRSAEKELGALPARTRSRIAMRLLNLENDPRPRGVVKLQGQEAYRLRVGDYRVLFTIDDNKKIVMTYAVGHRRDVYR